MKRHKHHHDWGNRNDNSMRYERAGTMHFGTGSEAYQGASIWKTCQTCGREFMGEDSLRQHTKESHG